MIQIQEMQCQVATQIALQREQRKVGFIKVKTTEFVTKGTYNCLSNIVK